MRNYYASIKDLPVYNWLEFQDSFDLSYLHKKGKTKRAGLRAFKRLQREFIEEFGYNAKMMAVFMKKIKLQIILNEVAITGDRSKLIFADVLESEIKSEDQVDTKGYYSIVVAVEKAMGFKIDIKKTTVFEFYNYIKYLKDGK